MLAIPIVLTALAALLVGAGARALEHVRARDWLRPRPETLALLAVTVAAGMVRMSIEPHHVMYVDEPWHLEAARRWLATGRAELCASTLTGLVCQPYPKSIGMPALLAPAFAIFGTRAEVAFALSCMLGVAAVPLAAWTSLRLGASRWGSLLPATLVASSSLHALYSVTAETNVAGATFALLAWGLALAPEEGGRPSDAPLAACAAVVATSLRAEAALLLPMLGLLAWRALPMPRTPVTLLRGLGPTALATALAAKLAWPTVTLNDGIYEGAYFAWSHLDASVLRAFRPADDLGLAGVLALTVTLGGAEAIRRGRAVPLFATLLAGLGVAVLLLTFVRFQPRMALLPLVLLAPISGFVPSLLAPPRLGARLARLRAVPLEALVVGVSMLGVWQRAAGAREAARHVPETQRLELRLPELVASAELSDRALVITEWPTVLAARSDRPAMRTADLLEADPTTLRALASTHELHFLCDMYCEPGYAGGGSACATLLERVELEPLRLTRLHDRVYGLHRIVGFRDDTDRAQGDPSARSALCPFDRRAPAAEPERAQPARRAGP